MAWSSAFQACDSNEIVFCGTSLEYVSSTKTHPSLHRLASGILSYKFFCYFGNLVLLVLLIVVSGELRCTVLLKTQLWIH